MIKKIITQIYSNPPFTIFTEVVKGETIAQIFQNKYCKYRMSNFNVNQDDFLSKLLKNDKFIGTSFHEPITNIFNILKDSGGEENK